MATPTKITLKKKTLNQFLTDHLLKKQEGKSLDITHTSMGSPKGSFHIPKDKLKEFYKLYKKELKKGTPLYIVERHTKYGPIVIDIDLKFNADNIKNRQHNDTHILKILQLYYSEIANVFNIKNDNHVQAYVFQRDEPYVSKNYLKDGIHIIFTDIISDAQTQQLIRQNVIKKAKDLFSDIPVENNVGDIFDKAVIDSNGWLMYGSIKPKCEPYKLTHVYDHELNTVPLENFKGKNFVKMFSIRRYKDKFTPLKDEAKANIQMYTKKKSIQKIKSYKKSGDYDIEYIKKLLNIISPERADDYGRWMEVGWCLHNIDPKNDELLDCWIAFSQKSDKFEEGACENKWRDFQNEGLTMGSLKYWAKTDNYDAYMEIQRQDIQFHIEKSLTETHYDVALVLYHMYKDQFVCVSAKNNAWYEFKDHRWHEMDGGMGLRAKISTTMVDEYCRIISNYNEKAIAEEGDEDDENIEQMKEKFLKKAQKFTNLTMKLKTTSFKDNVLKEARELFHDKNFMNKLNTKLDLIGFENGVYDLDSDQFREGRPDDYISLSTKIDYIPIDECKDSIKDEINEFMSQVFVNKNVRRYIWRCLSSYLQGHNPDEKFHIWTGCHAKDSLIMMYDGSLRKVQDVKVGEQLMGDDSTPRNVLELKRGFSDMYKIMPISKRQTFEPFVVNGGHIMCIKATTIGGIRHSDNEHRWKVAWQEKDKCGYPVNKCKNFAYKYEGKKLYKKSATYYENKEDAYENAVQFQKQIQKSDKYIKNGDVIEIPVFEYLKRKSKIGSRNYSKYSEPSMFPHKDVPLDPYLLGIWLGDGNSNNTGITTMDEEIKEYIYEQAENMGIKTNEFTEGYSNPFSKALKDLNLSNNKHIPDCYKMNSRDIQMQVLAGLIDSDGSYKKMDNNYNIIQKNEKLLDDIIYLSQSLGFIVTKNVVGTYYSATIFGSGIEDIPVKLERKRARVRTKNKNARRFGFKIERVNDDNYYGFAIDNNHRYLIRGNIVTHNTGSNSKSKIKELFTNCLGDYTINFPITMLTSKRPKSNSATPEIAQSAGKRFGYFDEPDEGQRINVGLMKGLTGGDIIKARALYKEPVEFKPQFKLVLLCNDMPTVPAHDEGTWRRICVIQFLSKFVDNPTKPNEFKRDNKLSRKMVKWTETFMSMLIEEFKEYKETGLNPPKEVTKYTRQFQKTCDAVVNIIEAIIEKNPESSEKINLNTLYDDIMLHSNRCGGKIRKSYSLQDFKKYAVKYFGKNHINGVSLVGYSIKENPGEINFDDDDDSDNENDNDNENENEKKKNIVVIKKKKEKKNFFKNVNA